jgi:hypothetical protein
MTGFPASVFAVMAALVVATAPPSRATPSEVQAVLEDSRPLGRATYRWLGLPLYEATLYAPGPSAFDWEKPLALELVCARALSVGVLLDSTLSELGRIEGDQPDHLTIREKRSGCFRGVDKGDLYVAMSGDANGVSFWLNGRRTCDLSHPEAKRRNLGIWLSEQCRAARNARALMDE